MTSARPCGMSAITARLAHVVREMSLDGLIGRAVWYGYNTPLADPCGTGTIMPSANIGWPVWIGPLSSRVARVVREVPLKGLLWTRTVATSKPKGLTPSPDGMAYK